MRWLQQRLRALAREVGGASLHKRDKIWLQIVAEMHRPVPPVRQRPLRPLLSALSLAACLFVLMALSPVVGSPVVPMDDLLYTRPAEAASSMRLEPDSGAVLRAGLSSDYVLMAENPDLELFVQPVTGELVIREKGAGVLWRSQPDIRSLGSRLSAEEWDWAGAQAIVHIAGGFGDETIAVAASEPRYVDLAGGMKVRYRIPKTDGHLDLSFHLERDALDVQFHVQLPAGTHYEVRAVEILPYFGAVEAAGGREFVYPGEAGAGAAAAGSVPAVFGVIGEESAFLAVAEGEGYVYLQSADERLVRAHAVFQGVLSGSVRYRLYSDRVQLERELPPMFEEDGLLVGVPAMTAPAA